MTYNGWVNYETWLTNIHFDGAFDFEDDVNDGRFDEMEEDDIKSYVATYIKEYVECVIENDEPTSSFVQDLINTALQEVDWDEIADQYMDDIMSDMRLRNESLYGGAD